MPGKPTVDSGGSRNVSAPAAQPFGSSWPIVTAYVRLPLGSNGATPVTVGVGRDGRRVGYYAGGTAQSDASEVELWLRLDPDVLADLPEIRAAVAGYLQAEANDRTLGLAAHALTVAAS